MEKKKPHYSLSEIKAILLLRGMDALTYTARNNSRLMGLDESDVKAILLGLQQGMLFKSMTTHSDNKVWQDVYHAPCPNGKTAYIKLTLQAGAVVIQFKEK